ncbi:hypothetical protein LPJ75_004867 [Coemansia sp. RSA 2598]|nr:hypothetical protein LPJ75_004867 [Coemansia sp. RSA 2598]
MSQRRHNQSMDPTGQFMPGEPGGFVLPLSPFPTGNASRSADCCQSPMGFVIPDVAAQHQQTWSHHAHMSPPAMPHGSPGGFAIPGAAPAYQPPQQQQQHAPPPAYYQQQRQQQTQMQPDLSASRVSFQQQPPPPSLTTSQDTFDSLPDGPAPSRYNSRLHKQHRVSFQLAPEVGGSRSVYPPPYSEYQSQQAPGYASQQAYPDYYQQQQQQQQQQNHSAYSWEGLRYNY